MNNFTSGWNDLDLGCRYCFRVWFAGPSPVQMDTPLQPLLIRRKCSYGLRWLACVAAAAIAGCLAFDSTVGAAQRFAWLMERARPACIHSGIPNEELHRLALHELQAEASKGKALLAVIASCHAKFRAG
jgi:hypothetical protein